MEDQDAPSARRTPPLRTLLPVLFPVLGTAIMVGGAFEGLSARFSAGLAALLGIGLAALVSRLRHPVLTQLAIITGLLSVGLIVVLPSGPANVFNIRDAVAEAAAAGNVLRPPVPFTPGWQAICGWLLGLVGFTAAWVTLAFRRHALAMLLPLPFSAIAAISLPKAAQVPSGVVVLILFAIGLGTLSAQASRGDEEEGHPPGFHVRQALRATPLLVFLTVALLAVSRAGFLFPDPLIDPAQEAQKPKPVALDEVPNRVLFTVEGPVTGPWRQGSLDVWKDSDWRLPPFAENELTAVPESGIVDEELRGSQGVKAKFTIAGLTGGVLPTLPNTVGIVASGPKLSYDARNGNIRVDGGQLGAGLSYTVTAATVPSVEELKAATASLPPAIREFATAPVPPPPAAAALIKNAPKTSKWEEFDFLRTHILDNVTASGLGIPGPVTVDHVQDMLAGSKEASPFEIVAAQAMFARWIGLPSRIGYGFDGGDPVGGVLEVRPKHGATFVEVYFPGFKWLPVIGTPKKAKPTVGGDASQQQQNDAVQYAEELTIELLLPAVVSPPSVFAEQLRRIVLGVVGVLALVGLLYVLWPGFYKAWLRARLREAAAAAGPRARIAAAYAEWRDTATDFGVEYHGDTPLMFVERFGPDREHTALAWLVTRTMWGDLQGAVPDATAAAAEELSRSLRRRLAFAQPVTVRAVAKVSRLSLTNPYAPAARPRQGARSRRRRVGLAAEPVA